MAKIEASFKPQGMELIAGMSVFVSDDNPPQMPEPASKKMIVPIAKQTEESAPTQIVPIAKQTEAVLDI